MADLNRIVPVNQAQGGNSVDYLNAMQYLKAATTYDGFHPQTFLDTLVAAGWTDDEMRSLVYLIQRMGLSRSKCLDANVKATPFFPDTFIRLKALTFISTKDAKLNKVGMTPGRALSLGINTSIADSQNYPHCVGFATAYLAGPQNAVCESMASVIGINQKAKLMIACLSLYKTAKQYDPKDKMTAKKAMGYSVKYLQREPIFNVQAVAAHCNNSVVNFNFTKCLNEIVAMSNNDIGGDTAFDEFKVTILSVFAPPAPVPVAAAVAAPAAGAAPVAAAAPVAPVVPVVPAAP